MGAVNVVGFGNRQAMLGRVAILVILAVFLVQFPVDAASAKVVRSGPRSSAGVALTFDDGWGEASCESIGKTLRREGVVGTFFINGVHVKREPARWRRILKGMPVANHTRSHPFLTRVSATVIRNQIRDNERIHEKVLGRPMLKLMRPPYGAYDSRVVRVAGSLGYKKIVLWSQSSGDTSSGASVNSIIRHSTGGRPGSIILMHCARSITAKALPSIIRHYKRRGIPMIGLDEMFGLAPPRELTPQEKMQAQFKAYAAR